MVDLPQTAPGRESMKLLFICSGQASLCQMAEALLTQRLRSPGIQVHSAAVQPGPTLPEAIQAMGEIGIVLSEDPAWPMAALGKKTFDIIITLDEIARSCCGIAPGACAEAGAMPGPATTGKDPTLYIGMPIHLDWPLQAPFPAGADPALALGWFRGVRTQLERRISALLELGCLHALLGARRRTEQILDAMEDGVLVHDDQKRIYLFNRAAERLTGYSREEVLGEECQRIFSPGGLCGSQCVVDCAGSERPGLCHYEVAFTTKQGEERRLQVRSSTTRLEELNKSGILATLRDITEVSELRWEMKEKYSFHGMTGRSARMQEIFQVIRQVTTSDYPILITGESGTGKELVARAIHQESRRQGGPFIAINCGALPENILESELFGHVRGAFTGAIRDKKGRFELADKGTLFLDEVGDLSPAFQVKLLRVLESKRFELVGGEKTIEVDVRIISATNRDLRKLVETGSFRHDLFYRLSVVPIHLPPLRERSEDLPLLIGQILEQIRKETARPIQRVSDEVMDALVAHPWPGNVRELINVLQFASVRCAGEAILHPHLPPELRADRPEPRILPSPALDFDPARLRKKPRLSAARVQAALEQVRGNRVQAAKLLGVGRATLYRFLDKLNLPE